MKTSPEVYALIVIGSIFVGAALHWMIGLAMFVFLVLATRDGEV